MKAKRALVHAAVRDCNGNSGAITTAGTPLPDAANAG